MNRMIVKRRSKNKNKNKKYSEAMATQSNVTQHGGSSGSHGFNYATAEEQYFNQQQEFEENDEENVVIDMADEDEEEDEEEEDERQFANNNNNPKQQPYSSAAANNNNNNNNDDTYDVTSRKPKYQVGDLIWFDPNQLGYSIPGKVLDFYHDLSVLTIEGCGQPVALEDPQLDDSLRNRLLLKADEHLQVYELSDQQLFKSIRPRGTIESELGVTDLVELNELSHESVVWNLKLRFKHNLIYTKCGHKILVSLNPHKQLAELYDLDQVSRYDSLDSYKLNKLPKIASARNLRPTSRKLLRWLSLNYAPTNEQKHSPTPPPHIFGLANEALKSLLVHGQDQCVLLLGDSGSGKTEAAKLLVQYYATVNKSTTNLITEQILESIQVLESFGNARTILNHNSSRFGKLLELRFSLTSGFIQDAQTIDLNLLDRTRIVCQNEGERNFNIFYELLAGLSQLEKEKYGLQSAEKYFYLNQGHVSTTSGSGGKDDAEDFRSLLSSMQVLGFNYEEQDTLFRILATILHLGNIYFHRKVLAVRSAGLHNNQPEQQQQSNSTGVEGVEIGSDTEARWVSHLLQVQFDLVMRCLTLRTIDAGGSASQTPGDDAIVTPLNIDQALDTRDAIARALYTCLFKWLIQRLNVMTSGASVEGELEVEPEQPEPIYLCRTSESLCEFQPNKLTTTRTRRASGNPTSHLQQQQQQFATLTILDAFGFENLGENNFEQLCINYAAELLHYHTQRYLVRLEQAEYARERIRWQAEPISGGNSPSQNTIYSSFNSAAGTGTGSRSQAIVSLISRKPLGILALLDDECNFPKATDQSFAEKCHHNHALNENYQCARLAANCQEFGIRHFRQTTRMVWYQVDGFVEKNRDSLRPDVMELLLGSKMTIVADMLRKLHARNSAAGSDSTLRSSVSQRTKTTLLSRTYDGRFVSMKPRAATVAAKFQDTLQNNRVLEALNHNPHPSSAQPASTDEATDYATPISEIAGSVASAAHTSGGANLWFILCVKPNRSRTEQIFDVAFVQEQVKSMQLLELTRMRQLGYPVRLRYPDFLRRYKCLHSPEVASPPATKSNSRAQQLRDTCRAIVECRLVAEPEPEVANQFQFGLSKMFLNERLFHKLEGARLDHFRWAIVRLQASWRQWRARNHFQIARSAATVIQAHWRGHLARRRFLRAYLLVVLLQRRWRRALDFRRKERLEARRRALKQQQQQQLLELQTQQAKLANQLRFRQQRPALPEDPNQSHYYAPASLAAGSSGGSAPLPRAPLLDVPEDLAQLYRLQRNWLPQHDLSHLTRLDLAELYERERARREHFGASNVASVPFVVAAHASDEQQKEEEPDRKLRQLIDQLELDERYSLKQFLARYFTSQVPQFGYSRLPITRPFSWPQLLRHKRAALNRCRRMRQATGSDAMQPTIERRFEVVEQKAVAIYKLLLRYIDSDQSGGGRGRQVNNEQENDDDDESMQRMLRFKLISDYVNYLCLTEPLLRDEVLLQLVSLTWQNPRLKSIENTWKLMLNCLACFEPLDFRLAKHLLKYASDHCATQSAHYKQLICRSLYLAYERTRKLISASGRSQQVQVNALGRQRRYPTTILEYWANQSDNCRRLAVSVSCYMDDHVTTSGQLPGGGTGDGDDHETGSGPFDLNKITNYSNKTLVSVESHSTAEQVAGELLKARQVPSGNLEGWSLEVQHEGALSELSSRLRGDDHLLDHFARLELLPELVQLIDDDLEALDCEQLDELGLASQVNDDGDVDDNFRSQVDPNTDCCTAPECCQQQTTVAADDGLPVSGSHWPYSRRSWDCESVTTMTQQRRPRRNSTSQHLSRHSAAMSDLDLAAPAGNGDYSRYRYNQLPEQYQLHDYQHDDGFGEARRRPGQRASSNINRRSVSMQDLQLAATSALNGRYFVTGSQQPSAQFAAPSGYNHHLPPAGAQCCPAPGYRSRRRHSGSLRHLDQQHHWGAGRRRRSATPNSIMSTGYDRVSQAPRAAHHSASSSVYGYGRAAAATGSSHYAAAGAAPGGRNSRSRERQKMTATTTTAVHQHSRRSASSSARPLPPTSDYASTHSDYEQIGTRRLITSSSASTTSSSALVRPHQPGSHKQRRAVPAAHTQPEVPYGTLGSSAMSDTSEAPSLASHVRGVKAPASNGDLDRYLDDLFNPLMDGATDLLDGEMSDARSTLASGTMRSDLDASLARLTDSKWLSENIRGRGDEPEVGDEEVSGRTLSPTFESLIKSLRTQAFELEDDESATSSTAQLVRRSTNLNELNLSELKELNEKLEREIQAAQSARRVSRALSQSDNNCRGYGSTPPPPPPLPSFGSPAESTQQQQLDDIYSRAKTIRIGKWRWPPPSGDATSTGGAVEQPEAAQVEQLLLQASGDNNKKRASILDAEQLLVEAAPPEVAGYSTGSGAKQQPLESGASVGRLKISTEMKAKLEQLTNSSKSVEMTTTGSDIKQLSEDTSAPKRLNEQRKCLLEQQLVSGTNKQVQAGEQGGSKVLAVKQQLAAAAGVALSALDGTSASSSQASSRRQSSQLAAATVSCVGGGANELELEQNRRLVRLENDELGPQSRAAINQRQAFYTGTSGGEQHPNDAGLIAERPGVESVAQPEVTVASKTSALNMYTIGVKQELRSEPAPEVAGWTSSPVECDLSQVCGNKLSVTGENSKQTGSGKSTTKSIKKSVASKREPIDCLTYANVDWQVRVRKELFRPSESYDNELVIQLIFGQLVADVFNPRHWTRLNNKERAAIKSMMRDNSIGYAPTLPQIGQLGQVKRELVRMARSFGLYFTRSYQALNFACLSENHCSGSKRRSIGSSGSAGASSESSSDDDHSIDERLSSDSEKQATGALEMVQSLKCEKLALDWIDMVAVHHSGLRLVALVSDEQQGDANRQSLTSDRLSIRNSRQFIANQLGGASSNSAQNMDTPTPPIGYKVLETLKFRDMTHVKLVDERVLLVRMAGGRPSWLISSSQAHQLASLLKNFHLDYESNVRHTTTFTQQQQDLQCKEKSSEIDQKREQKLKRGGSKLRTTTTTSGQDEENALLVADDDHNGGHLAQRQTSNSVAKLHSSPPTNNVLAHTQRVLSHTLAPSNATSSPINSNNSISNNNSSNSNNNFRCTDHHQQQQQEPLASSTASREQRQRRRRGQLTSGGGGGSSARAGSRSNNNNNGESTPPAAAAVAIVSQVNKPTGKLAISEKKKKKQEARRRDNDNNKQTANQWQSSLSRMSNKFSLFSSASLASRGGRKSTSTRADQLEANDNDNDNDNDNQQQQVTLDAWIETKVDFEEENDDNEEAAKVDKLSAELTKEQLPVEEEKLTTANDGGAKAVKPMVQQTTTTSNQKADDGKYSMLQFALFNFREAIDKYSLEARTSLRGGGGGNAATAAPAERLPGDCSTLRGSLKLIESLRSSSSESSSSSSGAPEAEVAHHQHDWTWRELAEMVKFTRVPMKRSLLKLESRSSGDAGDSAGELERRAVDCFAAVMRYMGDLPTTSATTKTRPTSAHAIPDNEVECVYLILINCHNYPRLRDELYCQLVKQTTNNRSELKDSCLRGWRLLSLLAAYFDCSDHLRPYLTNYLESNAYDKRRAYHQVASLCLANLRKTFKYGGRKNVPSIEEIAALSAGRISKRQIYRLPGGTERVINTKSTTVVDDIIREICVNMLGVVEHNEMLEFSLYCIADGDLYTMPLNRDEYILDITTELIKNHQQYFLIFCRSIWHYPLRLDSKLYIEVTFNQIAPDYLEGLLLVLPSINHNNNNNNYNSSTISSGTSSDNNTHKLPPGTKRSLPLQLKAKLVREIARLAALLHRASGTDYVPHKDEVRYLVPKPIVQAIKQHQRSVAKQSSAGQQLDLALLTPTSVDDALVTPTQVQLVELVQQFWREMSAFDTLDAKAQFLDIVRHWPLFGSSFFAIKLLQRDLIQPSEFILALNKLGVQMLDTQTHETRHAYSFNEVISTRKVRSEDGALYLDMKCGNLMKRTIIRIQTDQAHEISRLIRQYIDIELVQSSSKSQTAVHNVSNP